MVASRGFHEISNALKTIGIEPKVQNRNVITNPNPRKYDSSFKFLLDPHRTLAYESWIKQNVKDKVVVDLGAGSGILCYLAFKYGAKKVIALEIKSFLCENMYRYFSDYESIEVHNKNFLNEDIPEADIYLHESFSNGLTEEFMIEMIDRAKELGIQDKLYPNQLEIYKLPRDCFDQTNLWSEKPSLPMFFSKSPTCKEFLVTNFNDEMNEFGIKPQILNNIPTCENELVWQGNLVDFDINLFRKYGANIVGWVSTFDGLYPVSNFKFSPSHWSPSVSFFQALMYYNVKNTK